MKTLILLLLIPILISGQTVTEKIKAKFKQINDAKIERLKECEELTFFTATTPATLIMKKEYGEWLKEFISLWDEYAKECASTYTYIVKTYWLEQPILEFPDYESFRKWNATWGDNYKAEVQRKQPDPIEFINVFLRNKLKEN